MTTIYVLWEDHYGEDAQVLGVFSTPEKRVAFAERVERSNDYKLHDDDMELDERHEALIAGKLAFRINMEKDGISPEAHYEHYQQDKADEARAVWYNYDKKEYLSATILAQDAATAIAVADQKRKELLVSGEWGKQISEMRQYYADVEKRNIEMYLKIKSVQNGVGV